MPRSLEALPERRRARSKPEDGARDLVHVLHDAVAVEHDEPVLDALDHRFDLRLRLEHDVDARALDRDRRLAGHAPRGAGAASSGSAAPAASGSRSASTPTGAAHGARAARAASRRPGSVSVPRPGRLVVLAAPRWRSPARPRAARRPAGWRARDREPAALGQQERRPCAPNSRADVLDDDAQQVLDADGRRDLAREGVERRRARLAPPRRLGLVADARRQVAREHGDEQEDEERQQVLRLGHGEREARLDEEEVVDERARGARRRSTGRARPRRRSAARRRGTPCSGRRAAGRP